MRAKSSASRAPLGRRLIAAALALPLELRLVLALSVVLHGCALWWGMPASDAWDNDGIAPRDILPGLAMTFSPGQHFTYPPLQLAILGLLTLPVTLVAVVRAGTTSVPDVIRVILAPGYMTAFTMTARVVSLLQSLGVEIALALVAAEIVGPQAPRARRGAAMAMTALFAALGAAFTYYSHTSNLDVPYLFWASLGVLGLVRAIARREPRRLRAAATFAALGIATKDQAYALFLLSAPACLAAWALVDPWARENARRVAREAAIAAGSAIALLLVIDGAVFNPTGFVARLRFLSGPASQDYATYSKDLAGRIDNLLDVGRAITFHYPAVAAALLGGGVLIAVKAARRAGGAGAAGAGEGAGEGAADGADRTPAGARRARVVAALVPLAVIVSFTLAFNLVARRVEERFTLPHALFGAVYAGLALERAWSARRGLPRFAGRAAACAILAWAAWGAARIDLTMLEDPRYDAEAWLEAHAAGATIETHGLNVYLPRFPASARVTRVGDTPPGKRSPIPGVTEIEAPLAAIGDRAPRFVVASGCYAWRYLRRDLGGSSGRIYPTTQQRDARDADAGALFNGLFEGTIGYRLAHHSFLDPHGFFEPARMHGSLNCEIFVFERQ